MHNDYHSVRFFYHKYDYGISRLPGICEERYKIILHFYEDNLLVYLSFQLRSMSLQDRSYNFFFWGGRGEALNIYWWGCDAAHQKGVLGMGTTPKRGLRHEYEQKRGLTNGHNLEKGGLKNRSYTKEDLSN